jgi:hypothetical protein
MDAVGNAAGILHIIGHFLIYMQLAREFEDEFERYQLKLDMLQMRLSRWVLASGIIDQASSGSSSLTTNKNTSDPQERTVAEILAAVQDALHKAQEDTIKIKAHLNLTTGTSSSVQPIDPDGGTPLDPENMRFRILGFLYRRRAQTTKAVSGMKWAFYKRDHSDRIIKDIATLIAYLEILSSSQDQERL